MYIFLIQLNSDQYFKHSLPYVWVERFGGDGKGELRMAMERVMKGDESICNICLMEGREN